MMADRLTYKGAVQSWECDSNGHMNVMYYINKFELGGRNFGVEIGLSKEYLTTNNLGIAVVEQLIQYKAEVFEDDLISVRSKAVGCTDKVMHFEHRLYRLNDDMHSATMIVKLVLLDLNKRKSVPLPEFLKKSIAASLSE